MDESLERLRAEYAELDTASLLQLVREGDLTPEAQDALDEALRVRGFRDRDAALAAGRRRRGPARPGVARWLLVLMVVVAGFLGGVAVQALAPLLWRSPDDRECQQDGFWYAEPDHGTGLHCVRWFGLARS